MHDTTTDYHEALSLLKQRGYADRSSPRAVDALQKLLQERDALREQLDAANETIVRNIRDNAMLRQRITRRSATPEVIQAIREDFAKNPSIDALVLKYRYSRRYIHDIVTGKRGRSAGGAIAARVPHPRHTLTAQQRADILQALANGVSASELAERYGIHVNSIHNMRFRERRKQGIPVQKIKVGKRLPAEQKAEIVRRIAKGESREALAAEYGVAVRTIANIWVRGRDEFEVVKG